MERSIVVNRGSPSSLALGPQARREKRGDRDFTVIAIIAAFNEEDIIEQVIGDLVEQGIAVYLLDDGSTDRTRARAERFLGRGLLRVEHFSTEAVDGKSGLFGLANILARKESLAQELEADWFINHDADEFRESPWSDLNLRDAIHRVDRLGYNAIDFELLNFWPTPNDDPDGSDVRAALRFYEFGPESDKPQVRCWKKTDRRVDLGSSAGHDVAFSGRRVFPLRFLLRHYPIRSQAHGERKIFRERRPRFDPRERERGWHIQYDDIKEDHRFLRDPATLTRYDPDAIRAELARRSVDATEADRLRHVAELEDELEIMRREAQRLEAALQETTATLDSLAATRSWRWTAPFRVIWRTIFGD